MKKVRIIKNKKKYFESHFYSSYENKKIIGVDFNDLSNADLSNADLSYADLSYADLSNADLSSADLHGTDLCNAVLKDANLCSADLSNADLSYANLNHVNLNYADLNHANLHRTYLSGACLSSADLSYANLYKTDLRNADLSNVDLRHAYLSSANLNCADLHSANLDEEEKIRKGKIISKNTFVYKKCQDKIIKLELQIGSIVFSINNRKCRTNKAKVISIDGLKISSDYDNNFIYEVGKIIEVADFNLMYNVECASGIHFFWTEEEVKEYFYQ